MVVNFPDNKDTIQVQETTPVSTSPVDSDEVLTPFMHLVQVLYEMGRG